jgi:hypothetical protein
LNRFQVGFKQMMQDYAKTEEFILEQQGIITSLEQTYQHLKEQHVVTHIEFDRDKQSQITQI